MKKYSIVFKSHNKLALNIFCKQIENILRSKKFSYWTCGKPIEEKRLTLLKSPHVYKKFKEHYKMNSYKRSFHLEVSPAELTNLLIVFNLNRFSIVTEIIS